MIKEIRTLSACSLIKYLSEHNSNLRKDNNMKMSELFAIAAEAQESGTLTTKGLESIAQKILELQNEEDAEIIWVMRDLQKYCRIDFERLDA